jgi:ADP-heptose:LPS heptosyltransferase
LRQSLKHLERSLKLLLLAALRRFFGHAPGRSIELGLVRRILLVRVDRIGDAILSTPAIEILRKSFPEATIDIVLGRRNRTVAQLLPFIDNVFSFSRPWQAIDLIWRLRRGNYDVAIDMLYNDSFTAAAFTIGSGARVKIGFEGSVAALYDITVVRPADREHHVPTLLRLIAPLGIEIDAATTRLSVSLPAAAMTAARTILQGLYDQTRRLIIINISGSTPAKFWGVEPYARLARDLERSGFQVLLLAVVADGILLERIAREGGVGHIAPNPDLAEVAALLSFADLVVSPDTSIVHIAAALGKPTVDLVPVPQVGVEFGPWGVPHRVISGKAGVGDIAEAEVQAAIRSLAEEGGTSRPIAMQRG